MFFLISMTVLAQDFGDIKGVVQDVDRGALPGVTVALTGSKIVEMNTVTSKKGNFRFLKLPVGSDYVLKFELPGFKTHIQENIVVMFGRDVNFDITLEQATLSEEVTVVAQNPVIDTKRAQVGVNITEEMIMQLPTARNPWVLMSLIPGMLVDREDVGGNEGGQQSSYYGHGSRDADNTWSVDGANITDNSALGAAPAYLNIASYEELQINYGNNDIKSQTGGVQINLVTRRGANKYSGMFYLDAERNAWQADNVPDDLKDQGYTAAGINKLYMYGANFGGPIVNDKAWFYLSWGIQDIDALTLAGGSDKTWLASGYGRLDVHLTPSTRVNFYMSYDNKQKWNRADYGYTQQEPDTYWNQAGPGYLFKGQIEQMFGDLYLDAKFIYTDQGFHLMPVTGERTEDGSGAYMTYIDYPEFLLTGNNYDYGTDRNQINLNLNGVYFAEDLLGADHEFKFGVDYVNATTTTFAYYEGNLALYYAGPDPALPTGEFWMAWLNRDYLLNYAFTRYSAYVQDTLSFGRVAVNLGLRYDYEKSTVKDVDIQASPWLTTYMPAVQVDEIDPGASWNVFSPRFSISYDLFGNGKDVIKFSVARYGSQSGNMIADYVNPVGFTEIDVIWQDMNSDGRVTSDELYGYDWATGGVNDVNDPNNWMWSSSSVNIDDPGSLEMVNRYDSNFNSPYLDEVSLFYEKELFRDFAARLELFYKKYHKQIWRRGLLGDGTIETEDNYYVDSHDATVDADIYGRYVRYPYEYITNHDKAYDQYLGIQLVWTKRLSGKWMMNGSITWSDWKRYYKGEYLGIIDNIQGDDMIMGLNNQQYFNEAVVAYESAGSGVQDIYVNSRWQFKLSGLYQFPLGINFSGVFYAREGYVKPNNVLVLAPGIDWIEIYGSEEGAGKFGNDRLPAFWVLNFRLEKAFEISEGSRVIIAVDAFNITNSSHALKQELRLTSPNFGQDLRILNPRIFRVGVQFMF